MTHFPDARQTLRSLVSLHVKCDEHTPGMSTGSANSSTHLCTNGSFSGTSSGKKIIVLQIYLISKARLFPL